MVVEHPLRQPLETFVVDVPRAVEPGARRAGDDDAVVASDAVARDDHVRATQDHPSCQWCAVVSHEHMGHLGAPDVAEVPQTRGGDARDDRPGVGEAGGGAPALERVG